MVLLLNLIFVLNDSYPFLTIFSLIYHCLLNSDCLVANYKITVPQGKFL